MKNALLWLIAIIIAFAIMLTATGFNADRQTQRLYAQAHLTNAQSSARQDLLAGLMPYTIIAVAVIGGTIATAALIAGAVAITAIWASRPQAPPTRVIERQTMILLQPGQTPREFWRQMSDIKLLEKQ